MNQNECGPGECENDPKYTTPYVVPALPNSGGGAGGADLSNYYTKAEIDAKLKSLVDTQLADIPEATTDNAAVNLGQVKELINQQVGEISTDLQGLTTGEGV